MTQQGSAGRGGREEGSLHTSCTGCRKEGCQQIGSSHSKLFCSHSQDHHQHWMKTKQNKTHTHIHTQNQGPKTIFVWEYSGGEIISKSHATPRHPCHVFSLLSMITCSFTSLCFFITDFQHYAGILISKLTGSFLLVF